MKCSNFTRKERKRTNCVKNKIKLFKYITISRQEENQFYLIIKKVKQIATLFITKTDYIKALVA